MSDLSAKKLKKAQSIVNSDLNFRHLGNVDLKMGIKVGRTMYLISFEGFSCHTVRKISAKEVRDTDFVIEMSPGQWDHFIAGCRSGNGPGLAQLDSTEYVVKAADPRKKLEFLRYHTSIQAFFEAYATLEPTPA
ncbi:MAG: hypothetical protein O6945_01650 [Gammaproteobacteria bacterium]|nr:hypothetical protein [Gammaproteobacteria bacterium]